MKKIFLALSLLLASTAHGETLWDSDLLVIGTKRDLKRFQFEPSRAVVDSKARFRFRKWAGGPMYRAQWSMFAQDVHRRVNDWPLVTVVLGRFQSDADVIRGSEVFNPWTVGGVVTCQVRRLDSCEAVIRETVGPRWKLISKLRRGK